MSSDDSVLSPARVRPRLANILGRAELMVIAFDGTIARFEVLGRHVLTELGSYEAVVDRYGIPAVTTAIVSDQISALWRARNSGLTPIGLATRRARRKHLAAWGGDEFAAVVSNMTSLAVAISACPVVAVGER
ncbi:hypothetical protein AB0M47_32460 [Hamadaea sp. NPDC051192]|uniref:hypothetical protein n=1 Tax=Hamadaea sp. NPDC051192 TaxID=3154940 RepID=UPI003443CE6A